MLRFYRNHHSSIPIHLICTHFHSHYSNSNINLSNSLSDLLQGRISHSHLLQIHARVLLAGAHQDNLIATRLIGQYTSLQALRVFNQLEAPNIYPFNAIIRVLSEEGLWFDAFSIFNRLRFHSLSPNDFTFSFLLKACLRLTDAIYVKQLHTHLVKVGFSNDPFICSGLLAVYAKGLKDLVSAHKVFDEMLHKSLVSCWTCLISGYAQVRQSEDVLSIFLSMVDNNLKPEDSTMVSVLSACSNLRIAEIEKWVGELSRFVNTIDSNHQGVDSVRTVLVYLFGKSGKIDRSRESFDEISKSWKRSVLPWNAMISAYIQNGSALEALTLFRQMVEIHKCEPNHVTIVSMLSACAQIGDLDGGIWAHKKYINLQTRKGISALNRNVATALIDMYSKCGCLRDAQEVFDKTTTKDIVTINAMIMGLATNGEGESALSLFSKSKDIGLKPNGGTLLAVLCACSHSGLLNEGREIFLDMSKLYSLEPKLEHYSSYIDLLARVGRIEEAIEVVNSMPFAPNEFVWGALLGGCLLHNRPQLAQVISRRLAKTEEVENSGGYVMLSNAFAVDSRWGDVSNLRALMRERGIKKLKGQSWISINGVVHEFAVGFTSHPQIESLYYVLNILAKQMSYS
ncbi:putative pentatricopeptide repeat-containing protein At3g08820 [Impatiens glandulifera]|uniref:putative pentatricopeptide repeat-containing protein At3g08820 n=1 Tax=Impatiens glandulifera TaxID=253017 RepID=UPI001FB08DFA|nr:putative pentatricopeptide repeat-containing protein At3g08820 [Impatiens glandulifera]